MQLEHEVLGETVEVAPNGLVEVAGGNPIECRQIGIKQNALAAQGENQMAQVTGGLR
jgi:hypothetical protein